MQKERDSGKKRYQVKNKVICNKRKHILFLSHTCGGSKHYKTIQAEEGWQFPKGIIVNEDSSFQGHEQAGMVIPCLVKKLRGRQLAKKQKAANRAKARKRVEVEHSIAYVKIYCIVKEGIQIRKNYATDKMRKIACGLANFKLAT